MVRRRGYVRIAVAAVQLVVTFAATTGVGSWMAAARAQYDVQAANSAVAAAHSRFQHQVGEALGDGTGPELVADLVARERMMMDEPAPQPTLFADRRVVAQLHKRAADLDRMTADVALTETDAETGLWQQLTAKVAAMRQDLVHARDIGLDTASDDAFLAGALDARVAQVPATIQSSVDGVTSRNASLKLAIAAKEASNAAAAALQAAKDNAGYQKQRAAGDLAQAQATSVLDVAAQAAAIAALDSRFPSAASTDDFNSLADGYAAQARVIENLLYTRSSDFSLLNRARSLYQKAQSLNADLGGVDARLADLSSRLDQASNLGELQDIGGLLSVLIRDLNGAIFDARTRPFQPAGAIIGNVPFFKQVHSLSCEAASLQMALAKYNITANQGDILNVTGMDTRQPVFDAGGTLHWGDPYATFVGNVDGYENATSGAKSGYGMYWTPIKNAATHFGAHVTDAGEGIAPSTVYNAAHNQQPVVVWVAYAYQPQPIGHMVTWGGNTVMYGAPVEHAVTVSGWAPGYVLINNPHSHPEWIDTGTFERAYAMFNNMAVVLQP
jgi:uncharacterized protein YvpB